MNHFSIISNGDYVLSNPGYVKRRTIHLNSVLIDGYGENQDLYGLYGSPHGYVAALDASYFASVESVSEEDGVVTIVSDASKAYTVGCSVKSHTRKIVWLKQKKAIIVCDDIACKYSSTIVQRFYPAPSSGTVSGNTYTGYTSKNIVKIRNLSPLTSTMNYGTQFIEDRSCDDGSEGTEAPVVKMTAQGSSVRMVAAICWQTSGTSPVAPVYDESEGTVTIGDKTINL